MTDVDLKNSSNTVLLAQDYTYDATSNILTHAKGGVTTTYTYDDIGQLLSENRSGYSCSYTYDANGNRATRTLNGTTETYTNDSGDKLTQIAVGGTATKTFTYDAAGRTTAITSGGVSTNLTYDYESRVTQISRTGSTTNTFSYNGLDTRVSKVDSGGTSTYKRAGAGVTAPVLADGFATFTPGTSERRSSVTTYSHAGIKNMTAQTGSAQTVSGQKTYDAFGQVVSSSGTWYGGFGYGGSFGYQSDADYGLQLLGHRYYDASTGRFLTRDPIKDGRNWYGYCDGNPITNADPTGEVRINVYGYDVFGFTHVGIEVIDTHSGKRWYFAGGPQSDIMSGGSHGALVDWGSFGTNQEQRNFTNKQKHFYFCLLHDARLSAGPYVKSLSDISTRIDGMYKYKLFPHLFLGYAGNSNTWAGHLIDESGWSFEFDTAFNKKFGNTAWPPAIPGLHSPRRY